jgi:hypothetical protein
VGAAAGDIACPPDERAAPDRCQQRATADLIVAADPRAVLPLGDLQYEDGSLADYRASYDRTWGRLRPISHPVPGNHEYGTAGAEGYFHYFGAAAGDPDRGYDSFDVGSWHLVALNSNCGEVGGCGAGSPQERWLRHDLAADDARCTLAYWHHPRFSSGTEHGDTPSVAPLWQALEEDGADVVLSGHEHSYERFSPQDSTGAIDPRGIREFVVGTGGRSHYPMGTPDRWSERRVTDTFGVLFLTLRRDGYDWRFTDTAGKDIDAGQFPCH